MISYSNYLDISYRLKIRYSYAFFIDDSHGRKNDIELRSRMWRNKKIRKHICGNGKMDAMFIDARTMDNDVPWDETQDYKDDIITKNTPL